MIETAEAVLWETTCQINKRRGESKEITATQVVITSNTNMMMEYSGNLVNFIHQQALRDRLIKVQFDAHLPANWGVVGAPDIVAIFRDGQMLLQ